MSIAYSERVRARLVALIQARGFTLTSASRAVGCGENYLRRKLHTDVVPNDRRDLSTVEVDRVLDAIGAKPEDLEKPMLTPAEKAALRWLAEPQDPPLPSVAAFEAAHPGLLRGLVSQAAVEIDCNLVRLTPCGRKAAR